MDKINPPVNITAAVRFDTDTASGTKTLKQQLQTQSGIDTRRFSRLSLIAALGGSLLREHAPWALEDYGFRAIIAPSFADIFFNNCYKNGLLPIVLTEDQVDQLFKEVEAVEGYRLSIDLEKQTLTTPSGQSFTFDITEHRKHCLLNGLDEIGLTLQHTDEIKAFEEKRKEQQPWLFNA